jgi:hypothetical protein
MPPCSMTPAPPCSCTVICMATTWCGTVANSVSWWTSRRLGPPSRNTTCAPCLAPAWGPGLELLSAVMDHYRQITGRQLATARVMAWHVRTALGDVLWRTDAGIPLADHRTGPEWVSDVAARFRALGIEPEPEP